jgi:hypothetical protein
MRQSAFLDQTNNRRKILRAYSGIQIGDNMRRKGRGIIMPW